ncbi:hypothetical protein DPMN_128596 [Dreissena polymorpha]|uniref:G-protein coupled receptors family 1 profile domain-containing protein n=1 Tax=Dreissena polymorpha TaxID=45954 RepID=A0A9D4JWL1_DREPO|nr:hypothetical protein DPMN_128596 [Dreissena polymorpha]
MNGLSSTWPFWDDKIHSFVNESFAYTPSFTIVSAVSYMNSSGPTTGVTGPESPGSLCYTCTGKCVYDAMKFIFVFGIIANCVVIWRTVVDKKLRSATFAAIASLAFSDAVFLILNMIGAGRAIYARMRCIQGTFGEPGVFLTIVGIAWFAANMHISMIAVVRYILLLHPLEAKHILTKKRVLIASVVIWIVSIVLWTTFQILSANGFVSSGASGDATFVIWAVAYLLPVFITVFLHLRKWFVVQSGSKTLHVGQSLHKTSGRISKLMLVIIVLAVILPIPKLVFEQLAKYKVNLPSHNFKIHSEGISMIFFLTNNSINPVLYAFISPQYRHSMLRARDRFRELTSSMFEKSSKFVTSLDECKYSNTHVTGNPRLLPTIYSAEQIEIKSGTSENKEGPSEDIFKIQEF